MSKVQEKYKNFILSLFYKTTFSGSCLSSTFRRKSSDSLVIRFFFQKIVKKRNILSQIPF
jgi:hypothetical protein